MIKTTVAAGALALSLMAGSASATVLFAFEETGGNVVGTFSGSLDLTDAVAAGSESLVGGLDPSRAVAALAGVVDSYLALGPTDFGPGLLALGMAAGDAIWLVGEGSIDANARIGVPSGYASGGALAGTLMFPGESFASLGVTPGAYVYSLPNDTVTVHFEPAAVPLPAALPLLLGALGFMFAAARRHA